MSASFAKYDATTGRILFTGQVPVSMIELQGDNVFVGETNIETDYIVDGEKVARPVFPASLSGTTVTADGNDPLVIANVPSGTALRVIGPTQMRGMVDTNTDVTLTFALPGVYTVTLNLFPYQEMKATIHAI